MTHIEDTQAGADARSEGRSLAEGSFADLNWPEDPSIALAWLERLGELVDDQMPSALQRASESRSWSEIGGALGVTPTAASQRLRRYRRSGERL